MGKCRKQISVRIPDEELQLIKAYAKSKGQTVTAFVKETVFLKIKKELEANEETQKAFE